MKTPTPHAFDVAVAGGGPAGSATAIALAQRGRSVVLFERQRFPRFHIGESLLATANERFAELGMTDAILAADFPKKWGARLATFDGKTRRLVEFASGREVRSPQTWQVGRGRFDAMLLERARAAGAIVREATRVSDVEFDAGGVTLVATPEQGAPETLRVGALVDATGRDGLLGKRYGLREDEPLLANVAIFAHYSGVPRPDEGRNCDIRLVACQHAGWFWLIPIDHDLTSVGVVLPRALYMQLEKGSPEEMLDRAIADAPAVAADMANARREWPVRVERDFSYASKQYAGDRWLLAGDAGSFLDPVFSTGVSIALESGIEAAEALDRAFARGDLSRRVFRGFERVQRRRFESFRRFVLGFYTPWFRDLFFSPDAPGPIFRAVVTVLAGNWRPRFWTRRLIDFFFFCVAFQRRFPVAHQLARRDRAAGFPASGATSANAEQ
jgi:flavin-dependent dehydrogenase